MVQKIVSEVVANIAKDAATVDVGTNVPIPVKEGMRQIPKRQSKSRKKSWRHYEAEFVHWKVVVNSVKKEVGSYCHAIVWHPPVLWNQPNRPLRFRKKKETYSST